MPLVEAARQLKIGYYVAHRLALTAVLNSERVDGHWFVDRRDVERLARKRAADPARSAPAA